MTDERTTEAVQSAEDMASKVPRMLEALAERLGASAGASAVFGEPGERNGITVIPVAQSMVGTGAGGGGQADGSDSGLGAGGGALTRPLGYIEVSATGARFVPGRRPWQDPLLVLAATPIVFILARTLVKLVRG